MLSFSLNGALNALVNLGAGQTMKKRTLGRQQSLKLEFKNLLGNILSLYPRLLYFIRVK